MKFPLLLALLAAGSSALGLVAFPGRWSSPPPPSGKYTGVLTVKRALLQAGLETSYTVRVEATIAADGQITILSATPETPGAAANIENSVVRAALRSPSLVAIGPVTLNTTGTPNSGVVATPPPGSMVQPGGIRSLPITLPPYQPGVIFNPSNYLVNGSIPATVTTKSQMVYLNYSITKYLPLVFAGVNNLTGSVSPGGVVVASTSPATSVGSVATSPASTSTTIIDPALTYTQGVADSRVSYDFALRYQRPLPTPASITGTVR